MQEEKILTAADEAAIEKNGEVTEEAFAAAVEEQTDAADNAEIKPAAENATEFEKFLEQFPEADAEAAVKGAIKSGDFSKGCFTRGYVRALRDEVAALKEENNSEEAIIKKALASGKVTEAIVKEYLLIAARNQAKFKAAPKGYAPVLPPLKPKTIAEAGVLAGDIFKNKNV